MDTNVFRSTRLVAPEEARALGLSGSYTVAANFLHDDRFWMAEIPDDPVVDVIFQRPWFPSQVTAHVQARFVLAPDKKATIHPQGWEGSTACLSDLVCSSDGVPPPGDAYRIRDAMRGDYLMAHSLQSLEHQWSHFIARRRRTVEQIATRIPTDAMQLFLQLYLDKATEAGLNETYRPFLHNCASVLLGLLAEALRQTGYARIPERELVWSLPNDLKRVLRSWGVLDDKRVLVDLQDEFPTHPDAPAGTRRPIGTKRAGWAARQREAPPIPRPAVIAHGGAAGLAPESTAASFRLAAAFGVDYVEGAVQQTRDGVLVIVPERGLRGATDVATVFPGRQDDPVSAFAFDELQQLDVGSWFSREYAGERILRLEGLLDLAESSARTLGVYLEVPAADHGTGTEERLLDVLVARGWIDSAGVAKRRLMLKSTSPDTLDEIRRRASQVPSTYSFGRGTSIASAIAVASRVGASALAPPISAAKPRPTTSAHDAGLLVHPHLVDPPDLVLKVLRAGADGLFTSRPYQALVAMRRLRADDLERIKASIQT